MLEDEFRAQLQPDPAIMLVPPVVDPVLPGPAHRAQYVIEFVGPRSMPAASAAQILSPQWNQALGQPAVYAMAPADTLWRPLAASTQGSYDSLAACWDMFSPRGALSSATGQHLLQVSEQFAGFLQRRAMPLPTPGELDKLARTLGRIRENLDIGVSLIVLPRSGGFAEQDLWILCARLGLQFGSTGAFEWRSTQHPQPLFEVTPIGEVDSFSLRAVQAGAVHQGVTIGFNVPLCPAPLAAIDGALRTAEVMAQALGAAAFDQDTRPLNARNRDQIRKDMQQAVQVLEEVGIKPGSAAAIKLFST
jgi:hypothetical protein